MSDEVQICREEDLAAGTARRFDIDGVAICLAHCDDGFHAISDICSHEDYSLAEGDLDPERCEIECWKHGSMFSLLDGTPGSLPATRPVPVYEVVVRDGAVFVSLRSNGAGRSEVPG
jgi:3-phenylpropionate/trans-cinnamate dioxygenase ferredoxin component